MRNSTDSIGKETDFTSFSKAPRRLQNGQLLPSRHRGRLPGPVPGGDEYQSVVGQGRMGRDVELVEGRRRHLDQQIQEEDPQIR